MQHRSVYFRHASGFTLLELLVVLFIIGISVTFATLSFSGRAMDDYLKNEARRLHEVMRLASEDAMLQGVEIGLFSDTEKYQFLVITDKGWEPIEGDSPFREYTLREGISLEVKVGEFSLPPPEEETTLPQIVFLSSGEITPFDLDMRGENAEKFFRFKGRLTGIVDMDELSVNEF